MFTIVNAQDTTDPQHFTLLSTFNSLSRANLISITCYLASQVHNSELLKHAGEPLFQGWIPPFYPGSAPAERDACGRFDLPDPVSKVRCVVYDEGGAVFGENVFKEPVEKYISVYFLQHFTIIPGSRANKTVVRPLISPVEEVVLEPVFQAAKRFDTLHNICHGNPLAEILKQPITE